MRGRCGRTAEPVSSALAGTASFVPRASGLSEIAVTLGGEHISGSPFQTAVLPATVLGAASAAVGQSVRSGVAGGLNAFVVEMRDSFGNPASNTPAEALIVKVWQPGATHSGSMAGAPGQEVSTGAVTVVGNGRLRAVYTVKSAGEYLLEVRAGREHIAGSPYCIAVAAGPLHPTMCRTLRAGPLSVTAGQTAVMRFESCDRYGNRRLSGGDLFEVRLDVNKEAKPVTLLSAEAAAAAAGAMGTSDFTVCQVPVPVPVEPLSAPLRTQTSERELGDPSVPPQPTMLDELRGIYTVGYGGRQSAVLRLSIRHGGQPVTGSPFEVVVLPAAPCAANSFAYGAAMRGSVAGATLRLGVLLRDR